MSDKLDRFMGLAPFVTPKLPGAIMPARGSETMLIIRVDNLQIEMASKG